MLCIVRKMVSNLVLDVWGLRFELVFVLIIVLLVIGLNLLSDWLFDEPWAILGGLAVLFWVVWILGGLTRSLVRRYREAKEYCEVE